MKRRYMWITLGSLVFQLPLIAAAWRLDNWQRDLISNQAGLSELASDPLLRPIEFNGPPADLAAIVERSVANLGQWDFVENSNEGDAILLQLTHKTSTFGFVDDIHVTITPTEQGSLMTARSKSRIGFADLGQNPRNLKELVKEVQRQMAS